MCIGFTLKADFVVSVSLWELIQPLEEIPDVVSKWRNHQVPYGNIHCHYEDEDYRPHSHSYFRPLHSVDGFVIPRPLGGLFFGQFAQYEPSQGDGVAGAEM